MRRPKKTVVANWKMNPQTFEEAKKLFSGVVKNLSTIKGVETVVCPPLVYLSELAYAYQGKKVVFGAQDTFWETKGSHTGSVSPIQIKGTDAAYVIIGHSERRALGENNERVNKKVVSALKSGLRVILCVGEHKRDDHGTHLPFIQDELEVALRSVSSEMLKNITIAYEPIWAIGKSAKDAMQPLQIHEMVLFIKKVLVEKYSKTAGLNVSVLYGGSAEPSNVQDIMERGTVNGFLVGHASLDVDSFSEIVRIVSKY